MNNTILGIIIGSLTTLFGVGLSSLFNYLTKRKEMKHDEYLKDLELKDKERERKFRIEEKMIEKSLEAHIEAFSQLVRIFGIMNEFYTANGTLEIPTGKKEEISDLLKCLDGWRRTKGFFLEKTIRKQIDFVANLAQRAMDSKFKPDKPKMDIWVQLHRTIKGLLEAIETILEEYNPLYDLKVSLPEIEIYGE